MKIILNHMMKPLLHKKGKQWIVIGLSAILFCVLGTASLNNVRVSADTIQTAQTQKIRPSRSNQIMHKANRLHTMLLGSTDNDNDIYHAQIMNESGQFTGNGSNVPDHHDPASDSWTGDTWKIGNITGNYVQRAISQHGNTWLRVSNTNAPQAYYNGSYVASDTPWINISRSGIEYKPYGAKHYRMPTGFTQSDNDSQILNMLKPQKNNQNNSKSDTSDKAFNNQLKQYSDEANQLKKQAMQSDNNNVPSQPSDNTSNNDVVQPTNNDDNSENDTNNIANNTGSNLDKSIQASINQANGNTDSQPVAQKRSKPKNTKHKRANKKPRRKTSKRRVTKNIRNHKKRTVRKHKTRRRRIRRRRNRKRLHKSHTRKRRMRTKRNKRRRSKRSKRSRKSKRSHRHHRR